MSSSMKATLTVAGDDDDKRMSSDLSKTESHSMRCDTARVSLSITLQECTFQATLQECSN